MKKTLLFALAVLALTACKTKEQHVAEDYIKQHIKCPSTFKLVEYTQTDYQTEEKRDTLYRISKIKGKKIWDGSYPKSSVQAVYIDSVRESVRTIYSHSVCHITFDSQNLMGSTMRDEETIVVELGGVPYFYQDWLSMNELSGKLQHAWSDALMVSEFALIAPLYFRVGDWINCRELCKYGQRAQPCK